MEPKPYSLCHGNRYQDRQPILDPIEHSQNFPRYFINPLPLPPSKCHYICQHSLDIAKEQSPNPGGWLPATTATSCLSYTHATGQGPSLWNICPFQREVWGQTQLQNVFYFRVSYIHCHLLLAKVSHLARTNVSGLETTALPIHGRNEWIFSNNHKINYITVIGIYYIIFFKQYHSPLESFP